MLYVAVGKPANTMDKFNMDWFPTRELGHNKVDIATLEAANERAQRTQLRNKKGLQFS